MSQISKIMDIREPKPLDKKSLEVCFVRNIEALQEQQIFLVMRDKLPPHSLEDESLESSPFSLLRFRVAHSDKAFALMIDAEPAAEGDTDICCELRFVAAGVEHVVAAQAGGELVLLDGCVAEGVRSFSSMQHPALGGKRKWRVVMLPMALLGSAAEPVTLSLAVDDVRCGRFEGELKIV